MKEIGIMIKYRVEVNSYMPIKISIPENSTQAKLTVKDSTLRKVERYMKDN